MVGLIKNTKKLYKNNTIKKNYKIFLVGKKSTNIFCSAFLDKIIFKNTKRDLGPPPPLDHKEEIKNGNFIINSFKKDLISFCNDSGSGGMLISLIKMVIDKNIGFEINQNFVNNTMTNEIFFKILFGEDSGKYIVITNNERKLINYAKSNKINLIDLVIVNLYPFKKTVASKSSFKQCIENIDIGGPTLIRASAKNFEFVVTITNPNDYEKFIEEMKKDKNYISKKTSLELASKAFNEISLYDMDISDWFSKIGNNKNQNFLIQSEIVKKLRYGENPKQKAAIYKNTSILNNKNSFFNMKIIQGKELSYNNINDMQAGCLLADEINKPCVVIIKHVNPCGVSKNNNLLDAYKKAFMCDPISAFGGIVSCNFKINKKLAIELNKIFENPFFRKV